MFHKIASHLKRAKFGTNVANAKITFSTGQAKENACIT